MHFFRKALLQNTKSRPARTMPRINLFHTQFDKLSADVLYFFRRYRHGIHTVRAFQVKTADDCINVLVQSALRFFDDVDDASVTAAVAKATLCSWAKSSILKRPSSSRYI